MTYTWLLSCMDAVKEQLICCVNCVVVMQAQRAQKSPSSGLAGQSLSRCLSRLGVCDLKQENHFIQMRVEWKMFRVAE